MAKTTEPVGTTALLPSPATELLPSPTDLGTHLALYFVLDALVPDKREDNWQELHSARLGQEEHDSQRSRASRTTAAGRVPNQLTNPKTNPPQGKYQQPRITRLHGGKRPFEAGGVLFGNFTVCRQLY